jgi:hypothetical protein
LEVQPYTKWVLWMLEQKTWTRFIFFGPQQSGKSAIALVIPVMYYLFELRETVIVGVPDLNMAADKYAMDFLPALKESRYASQLPDSGRGSKAGSDVSLIKFSGGGVLKFMGAGGGDKQRASFTSPILCATEIDGYDRAGRVSDEADKLTQMEGRLRAWAASGKARTIMECTLTTENGRTWQEYQNSNQGRLLKSCPHCQEKVWPHRDDLRGWRDAATETEAAENAYWACPVCAGRLSERQRKQMLLQAEYSQIATTSITGGLRWNAFDNLFVDAAYIARKEWNNVRNPSEDKEKELCQFIWGEPYRPKSRDVLEVSAQALEEKETAYPRGHAPSHAEKIVMGIDCNKHVLHWAVVAWAEDGSGWVIDYGAMPTEASSLGASVGVSTGLKRIRDELFLVGWPKNGQMVKPDMVLVDSQYLPDDVKDVVATSPISWFTYRGLGESQADRYIRPKRDSGDVIYLGHNFHATKLYPSGRVRLDANVDYWKGVVYEKLQKPTGVPGALSLFRVDRPVQHRDFIRQVTSEKQFSQFVAGKGLVTTFQSSTNNHWLDALGSATVGAAACGIAVVGTEMVGDNFGGGNHGKAEESAGAAKTQSEPAAERTVVGAASQSADWFGRIQR